MERNNALYSRQLDEFVVVLVKKKKNIIPNCRSETENKPLCTYQFSVRFRFRVAGWRELAPQALAVQNKWIGPLDIWAGVHRSGLRCIVYAGTASMTRGQLDAVSVTRGSSSGVLLYIVAARSHLIPGITNGLTRVTR